MGKVSDSVAGWVVGFFVMVALWKVFDVLKETVLNDSSTAQTLEIDGQSVLACKGATVRQDGGYLAGEIFRVDYVDTDGLTHSHRGVRKVRIDDLPKTVKSIVPVNPSYTDGSGKDYVVGTVYTWPTGYKGRFLSYDNVVGDDGKPLLVDGKPVHNGTNWEPVDEPNQTCATAPPRR